MTTAANDILFVAAVTVCLVCFALAYLFRVRGERKR